MTSVISCEGVFKTCWKFFFVLKCTSRSINTHPRQHVSHPRHRIPAIASLFFGHFPQPVLFSSLLYSRPRHPRTKHLYFGTRHVGALKIAPERSSASADVDARATEITNVVIGNLGGTGTYKEVVSMASGDNMDCAGFSAACVQEVRYGIAIRVGCVLVLLFAMLSHFLRVLGKSCLHV